MTTYEENSANTQKEIQKLETLLQEPNVTVTRNEPLDRNSLAVYKGDKRIFTIKLVFLHQGFNNMGLDVLQWGIKIESDNLAGIFYEGPGPDEYTKLRKLYNSVGNLWLSPRIQRPNKPNLLKTLFHGMFTHKR